MGGVLLKDKITPFVEHPVPVEPPAEAPPPPPQPLPLTKRERKKLRTQRRAEAEREKQDQVRTGLMAPPEPKVKISNLMKALKDEAVADPSAMEAKVRAQMAKREEAHAASRVSETRCRREAPPRKTLSRIAIINTSMLVNERGVTDC